MTWREWLAYAWLVLVIGGLGMATAAAVVHEVGWGTLVMLSGFLIVCGITGWAINVVVPRPPSRER